MGGGIDSDVNPCDGSDVLQELNDVFNHPHSARYKFAQRHNSFGAIKNAPGNYRALIEAYETAGLTDINGWAAHLRRLGTGPQGPRKIYRIAHIPDHPGRVDTPDGLHVIASPSPRATMEEKAAAKPAMQVFVTIG